MPQDTTDQQPRQGAFGVPSASAVGATGALIQHEPTDPDETVEEFIEVCHEEERS